MTATTVLIVGATGKTGASIADGLLNSTGFHLIAAIRPSSAAKPEVESLKSRGVEIRLIDIGGATPEELTKGVDGVDVVVSAVVWTELQSQKRLVDAAKKAGVKRFIPCDWGTACVRGVRQLYDEKAGIQDYIKEVGLGYTFIDVGWWMEFTFPVLDPNYPFASISKEIVGSGNVKTALIDRRDIGKFAARIIADPRTLNQYVFCWGEEVAQNDAFALADRVTGTKIDVTHVSSETLRERMASPASDIHLAFAEYQLSNWIRGDNTIENAQKKEYGGALDGRKLYPDLKLHSLEDAAKAFYGK